MKISKMKISKYENSLSGFVKLVNHLALSGHNWKKCKCRPCKTVKIIVGMSNKT